MLRAQLRKYLSRVFIVGSSEYERQNPEGLSDIIEDRKNYTEFDLKKVHVITVGLGNFQARAVTHSDELNTVFQIKNIYVVDEASKIYDSFRSEYGDFLKRYPRGHGLWLWKPYFLRYFLNNVIPYNEMVIYTDAGNFFNPKGIDILKRNLSVANEFSGLFFRLPFLSRDWDYSGLSVNLDSRQISANLFMLKNNYEIRALIDEWLQKCVADDFKYLIGGKPSGLLGLLKEHRFDQAILTNVIDGRGTYSEEWQDRWKIYTKNRVSFNYFPFHALRLSKNSRNDRRALNVFR